MLTKKLLSNNVDKSLVNSATLGTMLTPEGRAIDGFCIVLLLVFVLALALVLVFDCSLSCAFIYVSMSCIVGVYIYLAFVTFKY